jgi:cysteine desulfurase
MPEGRVYLDHAATTPVRPEAREAMLPLLAGEFGNPSGGHRESRRARRAVDDAREAVAGHLGADLGEVVFTSGGTEADNLAVTGGWQAVAARRPSPPAIVCSAIEHHAVLETCRALAYRTGAELREVPADGRGLVDIDAWAEACTEEVGLVSVMAVNNEIGTVQPLDRLAEVARAGSPGAVLHTDAVQAAPWLEVGRVTGPFDLVSLSAHKFGGPQGVGALVVRHGTELVAQATGGGQERERRSGTPNVAGIVAMAVALTRAQEDRSAEFARVGRLRDRLVGGLLARIPGSAWTGAGHAAPGFCHLRFAGVEAEALVLLLDDAGMAVSAGAACSSGAVEASHVLLGMGFDRAAAGSGIRCSLGWTTTDGDIDTALSVVPDVVAKLRD